MPDAEAIATRIIATVLDRSMVQLQVRGGEGGDREREGGREGREGREGGREGGRGEREALLM